MSDGAGRLTVGYQGWDNSYLGFKWSVANAIVHVGDFNNDGRIELYRVAGISGGSSSIVSFTNSGSIAANVPHNPPPISVGMGTLVGRLPGEFAVDASGAATYEIPIDVPTGTNGLKPELALVYNSMADGSGLGVGWSLSGLSTIARCPSTLDQDGVGRGVELNTNDRFCLDGNKLRTTNGSTPRAPMQVGFSTARSGHR